MKSDYELLALCPEQFRDRLKRILSTPPDLPAGNKNFNYDDPAGMTETFESMGATHADNVRKQKRAKHIEAKEWGDYAEAITARYLLLKGLPIREWEWRPGTSGNSRHGEIDLISQRGNRIIFIEVKARSGKHSDPWSAITPQKIRELCHGADIYLKRLKGKFEYQFDVALITGTYDDYTFEYIEDAFMCPLTTRVG